LCALSGAGARDGRGPRVEALSTHRALRDAGAGGRGSMTAEPGNGWVILICPAGAQDGKISHGDREFVPYREDIHNPRSRWLVRVPQGEVAFHLCRVGGFLPLEA
jgi:hypothetical protein